MAKQHDIVAYQVVGVSTRRAGTLVRPFDPLALTLREAMGRKGDLEAHTGGLWDFFVVGIRRGETVEDAIARTTIYPKLDNRPWRLYAVEAFSGQPPGVGGLFWSWVWGRSEEEARQDFKRRRRGLGFIDIRAVVELTQEQEQAMGRTAPEDWREAVEAYARKNMEV